MTKIIEYLKGKKTFIVGGLMIALGLLQNNNEMVLQGVGFITLRIGLNQANSVIKDEAEPKL